MYADYAYYNDVYHGTAIVENDFPRLAQRASEQIDYFTFGCAATAQGDILTAVKKATCAVAEVIQTQERLLLDEDGKAIPGPKRSEKVGGHNVSYAIAADGRKEVAASRREEVYSVVRLYLAHTGLLYGSVPVI